MNVIDPRFLALGAPVFESEINFKKGLHSEWVGTFTSIYQNLLVVYSSKEKGLWLQHFTPETSTVSVSSKSEKGLFELITQTDDTLYFFEAGSDIFTKVWISNLQNAGWNSVEFCPPWFDGMHFTRDNHLQIKQITKTQTNTQYNEPSQLCLMDFRNSTLMVDEKLSIRHSTTFSSKPDPSSELKMITARTKEHISESGYGSKESFEEKTRKENIWIHEKEVIL